MVFLAVGRAAYVKAGSTENSTNHSVIGLKRKPTLSTNTDCCNTFPLLPEVGTKNVSTLLSIFVALIAFDVRVANALKAGTKKLQKQS